MNKVLYLFLILFIAIGLPFILKINTYTEKFSNYTLEKTLGVYPDSQVKILVQDTYPAIGKNEISNNTSNDIWWNYPIFKLGSYRQITNNLRYPKSPDEGTCMPGSMCNALYYDKKIGNNYVKQLPPINNDNGTRVGYFTADDRVITSLPYKTGIPNILY